MAENEDEGVGVSRCSTPLKLFGNESSQLSLHVYA